MKTKLIARVTIAILLIGGVVGLNSCLDDGWDYKKISEEFVLKPGVATPIAFGELSLKDLLTELDTGNYVEVYDDSYLYMSYGQELFSFPASEIIEVPDQEFKEIYINSDITNLPQWLDADQDTVRASKRQKGDFKFSNSERLDSAYIASMDLVIKVTSTFHHIGFLDLSSDSVVLESGETFFDKVQISSAAGDFETTDTIKLINCKVYFDVSEPGKTYLPLTTDFYIIKSGSPVNPVNPDDACTISMSFVNINYSSAYGYFGMYDLMTDDGDITLDVFDISEIEGDISFYNPQLILTVTNSYGFPVQIELKDISAYSQLNDTTTNIVFTGANPFDIPAPGLNAVGTSLNTTIEINRTNTDNLVEAIETMPSKFTYKASVKTNPTGPDDSDNFITDSSYIEVHAEVVLPIRLRASNFAFEDTVDFDFGDEMGTSVDFIEMLALEMDVRNGLPMEVDIQVFFIDSLLNPLDSMFVDEPFILPPTIAAEVVTEPIEYTKKVEFDGERLEKIKATKYMFVRATINSAGAENGDYVKFFDYYNIYFKLKMETALTINSSDL